MIPATWNTPNRVKQYLNALRYCTTKSPVSRFPSRINARRVCSVRKQRNLDKFHGKRRPGRGAVGGGRWFPRTFPRTPEARIFFLERRFCLQEESLESNDNWRVDDWEFESFRGGWWRSPRITRTVYFGPLRGYRLANRWHDAGNWKGCRRIMRPGETGLATCPCVDDKFAFASARAEGESYRTAVPFLRHLETSPRGNQLDYSG